jgi:transposase
MRKVIGTVENSSKTVLYAMDETYIRVESNNYRSWSPIGEAPILEKNGSHIGLNIIGATEISKNYDTIADVYSNKHSITAIEVQEFLHHLLEINSGKKVYVIMDNAKMHKAHCIDDFEQIHKKDLKIIYLPAYSPDLNPQENIWNNVKKFVYTHSSRDSMDILFDDLSSLYEELNANNLTIKSLANANSYYK